MNIIRQFCKFTIAFIIQYEPSGFTSGSQKAPGRAAGTSGFKNFAKRTKLKSYGSQSKRKMGSGSQGLGSTTHCILCTLPKKREDDMNQSDLATLLSSTVFCSSVSLSLNNQLSIYCCETTFEKQININPCISIFTSPTLFSKNPTNNQINLS